MGLSPEALDAHCRAILGSPRIRGKLVVLCEGERAAFDDPDEAPSPGAYARMQRVPDANFYRSCVNTQRWEGRKLPEFFNCGDRLDVLNTFARLPQLHATAPHLSYLSPAKLYAIVDLDLQAQALEGVSLDSVEALHQRLYAQGQLRQPVTYKDRVWVTALIHKEAFFLEPHLRAILAGEHSHPQLDGQALDLDALYRRVAEEMSPAAEDPHQDLQQNFAVARARLQSFAAPCGLNPADPESLSQSWLASHGACSPNSEAEELLVRALFTVTRAKKHWAAIEPPEGAWSHPPGLYRDQLALKIGHHISRLEPNAHPLAGFIEHLLQNR